MALNELPNGVTTSSETPSFFAISTALFEKVVAAIAGKRRNDNFVKNNNQNSQKSAGKRYIYSENWQKRLKSVKVIGTPLR
jgi:hypothetical protein